jgi:IS5 family transposase
MYRRLLAVAGASLSQVRRVMPQLEAQATPVGQRVVNALRHFQSLLEQVVGQTKRRVLLGEVVPAADKVLSLFEPHTAVLRRGKARVPAEFGRKVVLDEVDGGLVTRYAVLAGNPPDAPELPTSLAHHQTRFGHAPVILAADRGFATWNNEHLAQDAGVRTIALPRSGPVTPERRRFEHRPAFRRAYRFRAGVEGRISVLKRRFGLGRCRYHAESGMQRWVGLGILAHNFRVISRSLATRRAA